LEIKPMEVNALSRRYWVKLLQKKLGKTVSAFVDNTVMGCVTITDAIKGQA
jgi:hypothetical protein